MGNDNKRMAIKCNENVLYDGFHYSKNEFNVELYYMDFEKGTCEKKGFLYELNEDDVISLKKYLSKKYSMNVEIMWNGYTSEM